MLTFAPCEYQCEDQDDDYRFLAFLPDGTRVTRGATIADILARTHTLPSRLRLFDAGSSLHGSVLWNGRGTLEDAEKSFVEMPATPSAVMLSAPSREEREEAGTGNAQRRTLAAAEKFRRGLAQMTEALGDAPHGLGFTGWTTEDILGMAAEWAPRPDGALAVWVAERMDEAAREARS